jgi:hypothetical protein
MASVPYGAFLSIIFLDDLMKCQRFLLNIQNLSIADYFFILSGNRSILRRLNKIEPATKQDINTGYK